MKVFDYDGDAALHLKFSGDLVDTVRALSTMTSIFPVPTSVDYILRYHTGTALLVAENKILGGTSGFTAIIVGVLISAGTLAGGDAQGLLLVRDPSGTLTATGEAYTVGGSAACTTVTSIACSDLIKGKYPTAAYISVETNTIRYCIDGSTPTNSAATPASVGDPLYDKDVMVLKGGKNVYNLKFINAVSTSNGVLNLTLLFR